MNLRCEDISFSIKDNTILNKVSLEVKDNSFHTILGPNGCGKTTLLKNIYRILSPDSGCIYLDNKDINTINLKQSARNMAVVAQFNNLNFDCTVWDIVMLGRTPHISFLHREKEEDFQIVKEALSKVGMLDKAENSYALLSGGEKQRVVLARAIAQQPKLILLDEPTNHLDIKYQLEILQIIKELNINVLAVLHDIQLACRFSDYIYLIKKGQIMYKGTPKETITEESMREIYGVESKIVWTPDNQALIQYK